MYDANERPDVKQRTRRHDHVSTVKTVCSEEFISQSTTAEILTIYSIFSHLLQVKDSENIL